MNHKKSIKVLLYIVFYTLSSGRGLLFGEGRFPSTGGVIECHKGIGISERTMQGVRSSAEGRNKRRSLVLQVHLVPMSNGELEDGTEWPLVKFGIWQQPSGEWSPAFIY
jgi:hypothetical protein